MFKKRTESTDLLLQEERAYNEAIHRLIAARTRVSEQELVWANGEENPNFFKLFGKFAELQWIYNDAAKCMANKQLGVRKAFKNIFQEERILEESKKELQSCNSKLAKLQKQVENAKKRNDTSKVISLETELATQITLSEQLKASVESQSQKLELYKIKELKRSLLTRAEGVLTLAGHCQQLYTAHMQLIDLMPDALPSCKGEEPTSVTTVKTGCLEQHMSEVVTRVSDLLSIHPPVNGGIDPKKLAVSTSSAPPAPCPGSSSPHNFRRSLVDQIGLDIFRSKSKDELFPSAPPPVVRPKRLSQKPLKHPVYKVDTGAADEIEPIGPGGRSSPATAPLHSPISLSQITGITIEEASPSRCKPRVDYTQGMYCEIVIPDDGGVSPPLLFNKQQLPPPEVPIRRTSSDTPPNEIKHSRNLSLDRNRQMFEQTLKHSRPLESTTDSETASAQFSSSEDLEVVVGEVDPCYARVNIQPLSGPSPISASSQDSEESGGYANPVDALNFPSDVIQKRFSMGPVSLPENKMTGLTEEQKSSPYQSVEDVRKMRELQNHQRHQMKQNQSSQRSHSVSPNTSRTNLHGQQQQQQQQEDNEQVNYYDDNPGYSRPFDALSGLPHTKMTVDKNSKVPFTPLPPAMRRTASGDKPGKERSAKSLHMTNVNNKESETGGVDKMRGGSCKKSWKVLEPSCRGNGSMTPPPVPPTDRPRPMEQWQLPIARQRQQEKSVDKSYLRSRSDQSFKDELQATLKKAGANISDHSEHPSRGETGRTSSEGAMYRLKTKQPLMNVYQLKAKKLNPTKAN